MTCGESQERFLDYLDGHLSGSGRGELESHVATCDACASQLRQVRAMRARLGRLERRRLPDTFSFSMRRALLAEAERERGWFSRLRESTWLSPQTAWAAAIGSAVAVASFAALWFTFAPVSPTANNAMQTAAVDSAKHAQSVRYVLDHLPEKGELIESTANDSLATTTDEPAAPAGAEPVSASF